mmetsp:Transcript_6298/g.9158  ORF Transcript_6298/g.9158 Transcript_6298/m.9158 type:complete len:522 (+) Transcript_6298:1148-2713(+)
MTQDFFEYALWGCKVIAAHHDEEAQQQKEDKPFNKTMNAKTTREKQKKRTVMDEEMKRIKEILKATTNEQGETRQLSKKEFKVQMMALRNMCSEGNYYVLLTNAIFEPVPDHLLKHLYEAKGADRARNMLTTLKPHSKTKKNKAKVKRILTNLTKWLGECADGIDAQESTAMVKALSSLHPFLYPIHENFITYFMKSYYATDDEIDHQSPEKEFKAQSIAYHHQSQDLTDISIKKPLKDRLLQQIQPSSPLDKRSATLTVPPRKALFRSPDASLRSSQASMQSSIHGSTMSVLPNKPDVNEDADRVRIDDSVNFSIRQSSASPFQASMTRSMMFATFMRESMVLKSFEELSELSVSSEDDDDEEDNETFFKESTTFEGAGDSLEFDGEDFDVEEDTNKLSDSKLFQVSMAFPTKSPLPLTTKSPPLSPLSEMSFTDSMVDAPSLSLKEERAKLAAEEDTAPQRYANRFTEQTIGTLSSSALISDVHSRDVHELRSALLAAQRTIKAQANEIATLKKQLALK